MKHPMIGQEAVEDDERLVHHWRVLQLRRLGISGPLVEIYAVCVDWHQSARQVHRGCPPWLALRIVS
jgi:hypothetical protein